MMIPFGVRPTINVIWIPLFVLLAFATALGVGLWLAAMNDIQGPITRSAFLRAVRGRRFELGGLTMDFTEDNQGSDLVLLTRLTPDGYRVMRPVDWQGLVQR